MKQTTIILGAGASVDFGQPLGSALYDLALDKLKGFRSDYRIRDEADSFFDYGRVKSWCQQDPFRRALFDECGNDRGYDFGPMFALIDLMEEAPAYSIDTLALEKPEHLNLCRTLVAQIIASSIKKQILQSDDGSEVWNFSKRIIPGTSNTNWLHLFVSMMRNAIRRDADQRFSFISFNYDKIAETVMRRVWSLASQDMPGFDSFVEFTYPHGQIDWIIDGQMRSRFGGDASKIVFAHNKGDTGSFKEAREYLERADVIISLGFHFAPENIRSLFEEDGTVVGAELIYQNYDSNMGLDRRVAELGFGANGRFTGRIADAIVQGQLGELPS